MHLISLGQFWLNQDLACDLRKRKREIARREHWVQEGLFRVGLTLHI